MENKKISVLAVLEILKKYSDEQHILTQKQILNHLENIYGLKIDRRTLYQNIDMLVDFGYHISRFEDNRQGYYLVEREFGEGEIFYLCNAIYSSPYIPNKYSSDLIKRVLSTQSQYKQKDYADLVYVNNDHKKDNKDFFMNLETLALAIRDKRSVSFDYLSYDLNKKLVNRRQELYYVSPYLLLQAGDKTYLVARSNIHSERLLHYRVDKIKNIQFDEKHTYISKGRKEDPYEYARNKIYMYGGEEEKVIIRCDNSILDDIIERFGSKVKLEKDDDDHFIAYAKSTKQGLIYLALQYLEHMEVLEPDSFREDIRDLLKNGALKYK